MRVLVIGGAGFIGSNFCHLIEKERPDWKYVSIDKLTYAGNLNNMPNKDKNVEIDITNSNAFDFFEQITDLLPDVIINFAAETHVDNSIKDSTSFINTNIIGVHNILNVCKKYDIRLIQISTDEVLGDLPLKSGYKFDELSCIQPNNPYAATKASAELLVNSYIKTYGIRANITRCTNNYGKYQHIEKFIPKAITDLKNGKKIQIYGTGENERDWIHVEDHCRAILSVIEYGLNGKTYMFGGDNCISNNDVAKMICDIMQKDYSNIEYITDRKGHDLRYAIRNNINELDWKPSYNFYKGLKETVEYYLTKE